MTVPALDEHTPEAAVAAERQRILDVYAERAQVVDQSVYAPWHPAAALSHAASRRLAARMLHRAGVFPTAGSQCLEIGHGTMGWLADLVSWGVRESDLHGIELSETRASAARASLPGADLRVGDASAMPWHEGRMDLVIVSTVFTSILNSEMRRHVARDIVRVLKPGGALLWYDFAVNNPRNPDVKGVGRSEILGLFPAMTGRVQSVTLAPPIARLVAPRSWTLATMLEGVPFLRTHLMAVLVKGR